MYINIIVALLNYVRIQLRAIVQLTIIKYGST